MVDLIDITETYFKIFSNKDSEGLRNMFSENVYLRDWEILANGIDEVVDANQSIFDSVDTIVVTPIRIISNGIDYVSAELEIVVNDEETLLVTDILEFDDDKINSVRAYRG
tara:strand:- start:269 stop:601 length:333 start_codon:yes stop_codon:yes gene_type:complete